MRKFLTPKMVVSSVNSAFLFGLVLTLEWNGRKWKGIDEIICIYIGYSLFL